ncbi:MAG: MarR family transcriptional regulator [Lachnospiraceae bacterium]|nr:MarR family transcriptional regulator [Lachnospiraceae bacterium]
MLPDRGNCRKPGISIKETAESLKIDKSGVSRSVEELVQKEFVKGEPSKTDVALL